MSVNKGVFAAYHAIWPIAATQARPYPCLLILTVLFTESMEILETLKQVERHDVQVPEHLSPRLLQHLQDIIQNFACSLDIEETLAVTLQSLMKNMHTEAASVFLLTNDRENLICRACAGPVNLGGLTVQAGTGIVGTTVSSGKVQLIRDTRQSGLFFGGVDETTGFSTRSILCSPLIVQDEILGAIELINKIPSLDNPDGLFDEIDGQLLGILSASAALAIRNARMARELVLTESVKQELSLARSIQESFLPPFAEQHPFVGLNIAAKNVSGDFFDYLKLDDGRYSFNIGDVSGKGLNAALLMARASSLYHCLAKTHHSPAAVLRIINEELSEHTTRGMFVTMIAGIFDPATRQVTLANAGHLPAICHRKHDPAKSPTNEGSFELFESTSLPLGILPDQVFTEVSFSLTGGSLYLYTDGLSEGLARVLKQPDVPGNLQTLIVKYSHLPRQQRLQQFAHDASRLDYSFDDLTILLIED
ncbi:MAG: GAF domain-containing SpoIIE family protein phosphatase [Pseudomonadota bacterium]